MVVGGADSTINALSGGVAGAANIFTGFPFDTVKVRLQASPRGTYAGGIDCTRSILKFEGVCKAALGECGALTCKSDDQKYLAVSMLNASMLQAGAWALQRPCSPSSRWSGGDWC